jgi:lipoprotein-anchoring transpeptidase ErfK/SrfK
MSVLHRTRTRPQAWRGPVALVAGLTLCVGLAGCTGTKADQADDPVGGGGQDSAPSASATPEPAAVITSNLPDDGTVSLGRRVRLTAENGTFDSVAVTFGKRGRELRGALSSDQTTWTSRQRLEPGLRYRVRSVAVDDQGLETKDVRAFRTDPLTLDQQTYPSIAPLAGETVGVGMPVIVQFDVAVTDKASIEKHLSVQSSPSQAGAWHWISDHEVHWRPREYWQPGTQVTVDADINSIPAGNGVFGQLSRSTGFTVGDAIVSRVDIQAHTMKVFKNGTLLRTLPITTGKAGFTTRSGTKVIIEKFREKRMNSETVGIAEGNPEYYDIDDVEYAMRLTYSGEFIHAAPWSVGSQGSANVSHGCTGMSPANAAWLYNISKRGDVVEYVGSDRPMTTTNGYGDWNEPFATYRQGSALS